MSGIPGIPCIPCTPLDTSTESNLQAKALHAYLNFQISGTPLQKAKALHAYFNCIAALAKELFGKRFLEKTETCKRRKGVKKMYNYKTAKTNTAILAILNIAMKI